MREFFKPARRKVGVLTLVMACVFMAAWMRSQETFDSIDLNSSRFRFGVCSVDGRIWLLHTSPLNHSGLVSWHSGNIKSILGFREDDNGGRRSFDPTINEKLDWRWEWSGLQFSSGMDGAVRVRSYMIPYWCFITPLTLASAHLLLKKPKISTLKKIPEPILEEGE